MRLLPLAALALLAACRPSPQVEETDTVLALGSAETQLSARQSFTVGGRPVLFTRLNGTVEIDVKDTTEAMLVFTERVPEGGAHNTSMTDVLAGPQVRFTVERPEDRTAPSNPIDVRGVVPKGTPLEFRMDEGTVVVRNPDARVTVRMGRGTVQVVDARAGLSLDVDNGTVDATLAVLSQPLHLRTRNGSIALYLPSTASANLSARSGVKIDVEGFDLPAPEGLEGTQRLEGALGTATHRISLLATNGSILVAARPEASAPRTATPSPR